MTRLLAPFTPFLAEAIYQNLAAGRLPGAPDSVHLDDWPEVDAAAIDEQLSADVALVQRMVSLGRAARAKAQVKVRQPLATALLLPRSERELGALERMAGQIAEELNVKRVEVAADAGDRLRYRLRPNLPALGPRFGSELGRVRAAIEQADAVELVRRMRAGQSLELYGFDLAATDVLVDVEAAEGWSAAEDAGYTALLETAVTPELAAEGLARELVRRLQDLRREAGFEVTDRIHVHYRASDEVRAVLSEHGRYIAEETLALSIEEGDPPDGGASAEATLDGHAVTLAVRKA